MYIHINVGILFQLVFLEIIACDEEEKCICKHRCDIALAVGVEIRLIM